MDASGILNTHRQLHILSVSVFHSAVNFYCVADGHKKKKDSRTIKKKDISNKNIITWSKPHNLGK